MSLSKCHSCCRGAWDVEPDYRASLNHRLMADNPAGLVSEGWQKETFLAGVEVVQGDLLDAASSSASMVPVRTSPVRVLAS